MLDDIETRTQSRSALRHRPIMPDAINTQVRTPRASRARQKPMPYVPDDVAVTSPVPTQAPRRTPKPSRKWLVYLILGMLLASLLLWAIQSLLGWINRLSDDLHYGYPRTTQVDHFVGHETDNTPSHFIAINLHSQIYVIEIPGGSPNTSHLLVGPHLYGPDSDLIPVQISFPGDKQHPDLLITVGSVEMLFHNTGTSYVAASP